MYYTVKVTQKDRCMPSSFKSGIRTMYRACIVVACKQHENHTFSVKCCESFDNKPLCPEMYETTIFCGHMCQDMCQSCSKTRTHLISIQNSEVDLQCGHIVTGHIILVSQIPVRRVVTFAASIQIVNTHVQTHALHVPSHVTGYICDHYVCTKTCSEFFDRPPCDKPCSKQLACK